MTISRWARLTAIGVALAGCGLDTTHQRAALQADAPVQTSVSTPPPPVVLPIPEAIIKRITALVEVGSPDFYPKVERLVVRMVTREVRYRFEAEARVTGLAGEQPYRLIGTYHVPSDTLTFTDRIPLPGWTSKSPFTVSQVSSGNLVYIGRTIDWTGVNFPHYWEVDLDRGTAYYRYFSAVDRTKQWEFWYDWRPLPLTMGGGFQFTYGCSIRFVGDQVFSPLLVELGVNLGQLHSVPPAVSASATSVNRALVADQKMIVLTPMAAQPVGTRATIQLQPHLGPKIIYHYEYR